MSWYANIRSLGLSMYHVMCDIHNLKLQFYVHIMSLLIEDLTLSLLVAVFLLIAVVQTALDQKSRYKPFKKVNRHHNISS